MSSKVTIPQGNDKITIELTVKEAIALSGGVRFPEHPSLVLDARKKLKKSLENKLIDGADSRLSYH